MAMAGKRPANPVWRDRPAQDNAPAAQSRFNEGKLVEKYARQLFGDGIQIDHSQSCRFSGALVAK